MAKRNAQIQPELFDLDDLDSLLRSDESQDEQNDSQPSSSESNSHPKKFRNKDGKVFLANKTKTTDATAKIDVTNQIEEEVEIGDFNDVSKFFENFGNSFGKSIEVKKIRLNQFADAIISVYESKLAETIKKQECEYKEFKEQALGNMQEELNKADEELKKLMLQQNKIIKALEQQMKFIQKAGANLEALTENFTKVHKNFIQTFQDLNEKHRNQTLDLKKSLSTEISALQKKFLRESKEEEMRTMKKYLTTMYF